MSRPQLTALLLALGTLLVYLPAARNGFVVYDDGQYVTENRVVQNGLTWPGIRWAFTTGHASNWHPLTWISHMLDCEWFGLNAGAHHAINVLFHTANTVLLFLLLLRLTGAMWPAALVAALFAWHPLHVESVAWIAERKDVLSTCFALLALLAYVRYAHGVTSDEWRVTRTNASPPPATRHPSLYYWLALFFFTLGLMSKPMLVTLPFVMLLLDYWPLQRFRVPGSKFKVQSLFLEKTPFLLLALASCIVTYLVQCHGEAVLSIQQFPLHLRLESALVSYVQYLFKTVWPSGLAVLYPLQKHPAGMAAMAAMAAAGLAVLSGLAWLARRRSPGLLVGWLWFLGTLVPVIGLVQVGSAALADRYTYFPLIGIFVALTFGGRDLMDRFRLPKMAGAIAAGAALAACLALTENQLRYWRNSESLFARTLAVTTDNPLARINHGVALEHQGRLTEALAEYQEAARLSPDSVQAHNNLAILTDKLGDPQGALVEQRLAVQLSPQSPSLHNGLGIVLTELGRFDEAGAEFQEAERLDPAYPWAHFETGKLRLKQGRDAAAMEEFHEALRLDPDNYQILTFTAHVLAANDNPQARDGKTAFALATRANQLTGGAQPLVLDVLGMACAETGDFESAQQAVQGALDLAQAGGMKKLEPFQERLERYKNRQPWRESFLATNTPAKP